MKNKIQFRNMKPGTVFWAGKDEKKFALAKLWNPLPSQMRCEDCGGYSWNATNFGNNVHVCSIHKFEVTGYQIKDEGRAEEQIDSWGGYKIADLKIAFDRVASAKDWKGPIDAEVLLEECDITVAAIIFYTSTTPMVQRITGRRVGPDYAIIRSEGYRAGPAGDH